jgi:hypothetical protein
MNEVYNAVYSATNHIADSSVNTPDGTSYNTGLPTVAATSSNVQTILQFVFGIMGALAVIIILIAAVRFITAQGEPNGVKQARNTIIYAAIGLAICLSAEVLVTFVLNNV